jgi:RNA polymerase-interacting CarD/CdnL/TRCF family regulator
MRPGDRVVYPNQGVCQVVGVEEKDIAGQKLQLVRMRREEDGAAVLVPKNKVPSIGLRRVATGEQMEGVFHYLAAQFDDPELDWKVRHRDNADRLIAGGVLGVAEVVKGLHSLSRIRPLPTKEREQYDNARHLLVHEIAVSLGVPAVLAEDYVDYALMPPAGVTFKLKPPPKPVLLPSRPKKKRPAAEEEDDLGLSDLGIDIDLSGALEGAAAAEGGGDGETHAEGAEGGEAAEGEEAEEGAERADAGEEAEEEAPRRGAKAPKAEAKPKKGAPPAPAKEKPARKAAAKPAKPAAKAHAPAAARKPAAAKAPKAAPKAPGHAPAAKAGAKRGGKKK